MENSKIGTRESIALLVTIAFNHIIMNLSKSIIDSSESASLINVLYIGIISIIFASLICYLLNKFPTYDIIDISEYLGGKPLKIFIGLLFIAYFIFFAGLLLNTFSACLEIIYFQLVKTIYIVALFVIGAVIVASIKHNSIFRSNFIIFPFLIISTLFLFIGDFKYFEFDKMYPVLGNGFYTTFIAGLSNMFVFQGLAYIYFMPPKLKEPNQLKKVAIISIVLSCLFLLVSISIILFMFNGFVETDELLPLYSAVKYVEFGSFLQKLDSTFILIWIISFVSYLGIALKFSGHIFSKITNIENENIFIYFLGIILFSIGIWQKKYPLYKFLIETIYKYSFFALIIGICSLILIFANLKQKRTNKFLKRMWFYE